MQQILQSFKQHKDYISILAGGENVLMFQSHFVLFCFPIFIILRIKTSPPSNVFTISPKSFAVRRQNIGLASVNLEMAVSAHPGKKFITDVPDQARQTGQLSTQTTSV